MKQKENIGGPKSVVLTGYIGSGKTTLFNKICKASQEVKAGGQSVTQQVFARSSAYGMGFKVLDTPGLGIHSKKIAHACAIMCALSEGPISQILVVVKAERTDLMMQYLRPIINQQYKRFKNLITIVVTHWDEIVEKNKQQDVDQIKNEIQQGIKKNNVHSILFVSKQSTGEDICKQIDRILVHGQTQTVQLTETEFYASFDLIELDECVEDDLRETQERVRIKFQKIGRSVRKFIETFDQASPIMPEVMHALTVAIKNFADETISSFEKENNEKFSQLYEQCNDVNVAYLIHVELKKGMMEEVNALVQLAQKKMKVSSSHCFNFIKKCPYCGVVWFKVSGCDGQTTCGQFPNNDDSHFQASSIPKRYKFKFQENQVEFQDLGPQQTLQQKAYSDPGNKRIGCGQTIIWGQIPPLEPYLITELLDPGVLDYMAKEVSQEEMKKRLQYDLKNQVEIQRGKTTVIYV